MDIIKAAAHRHMRHVTGERRATHWLTRCPLWAMSLPLRGEEVVYAVYENRAGTPEASVPATTRGLYIARAHGWEFIDYAWVAAVRAALQEEEAGARTLRVSCTDGRVVDLIIRGGFGRFRDLFAFQSFLQSVVVGLHRQRSVQAHGQTTNP